MLSTVSRKQFALVDGVQAREKATRSLRRRVLSRLDEIAVFALVAIAVLYIAAASWWFVL